MKRINLLLMAAIIAVSGIFTSCTEDEDLDMTPTLVFNSGDGYVFGDNEVANNEEFTVGIIATANENSEANLKTIKVTSTQNDETNVEFEEEIDAANYNKDFTLSINVAKEVIGSVVYTFIVTDAEGEMKEISLTTTVVETSNIAEKREAVVFGAADDAIGSFYSVAENKIITVGEAEANQAIIDLVFFKGATNGDTFSAPDNAELLEFDVFNINANMGAWTTLNTTRFMATEMDAATFDAATDFIEFPVWNDETAVNKANQLEEGNVFMFKTVDGTIGLIKVTTLVDVTKGRQATVDMIIKK